MSILKDLSVGQLNEAKLSELVGNHSAVLKLAMRCKWTAPAGIVLRNLLIHLGSVVTNRVKCYR